MNDQTENQIVSVICDLRDHASTPDDVGTMETLWREIGQSLIGLPVGTGQQLEVTSPKGIVRLWVVETSGQASIEAETSFKIVDVIRNPKLIYKCRVCGEYGPLRCRTCEEQKLPARLCSKHAHMITDELTAYCPDHIPQCSSHSDCTQKATFRCRRCRRLYGEHFHKHHNSTDTDYCQRCYQLLFENCAVHEAMGQFAVGKARCAFKSLTMLQAHDLPLCYEHSYQWKIWDPYSSGITLCEQHKNELATAGITDLLYMILNSRIPYSRGGRRVSFPNPFRLRRVLNRQRSVSFTLTDIGQGLMAIGDQVTNWGSGAQHNYANIVRMYETMIGGVPQIENNLLEQIRAFYTRTLGADAAACISRVEVMDCFLKPNQPPRYQVHIQIEASDKGRFIGQRGARINELRDTLNIDIQL